MLSLTVAAASYPRVDLLHNVLRSPLRYFESTAHGTLLNRFSADMSRVDGWLPDDWGRVVQYSLTLGASFGIIVSVTPFFGIAIVVLAPIFVLVGSLYARITRDLRRLDSVALR
jgi:ABC-type multidrug transport system fused ATPase/permease subunit